VNGFFGSYDILRINVQSAHNIWEREGAIETSGEITAGSSVKYPLYRFPELVDRLLGAM
jgi:hypothetical protein